MMGLTAIQIRARAVQLKRQRAQDPPRGWQWEAAYRNADTQRAYTPHHDGEQRFVFTDSPRYALAKGGEGGGKSVAGIVKGLERLRRGMSGIMVSPDLPHFKRSLWPEFRRWCPPDALVQAHRYRLRFDWEPREPFTLAFVTGATLLCGGIEDPSSYEGPNVHFAHFDEARRAKTPNALKVLDGRVRMVGPHGEPPQLYITTTPQKHWLYDYFGPWERTDTPDPLADFKADSLVIDLLTSDNAANLAPGFVVKRRQSLTEAEARVLLEAAWEDTDTVDRFLPSMTWWDACQEALPPLDARTPLILALDAGDVSDTFAAVAVSRHPDPARRNDRAVRYVRVWEPKGNGEPLDFNAIEEELRLFIGAHRVLQLCFDKYQLRQMTQRLGTIVWCEEFSQQGDREVADKSLLDAVKMGSLAHDGAPVLKQHVANADRVIRGEDRLRIVKGRGKIDACVSLSMCHHRSHEGFSL